MKLSNEEFVFYFTGSWIRDPKTGIVGIVDLDRAQREVGGRDHVFLKCVDGDTRQVKIADIEWCHTELPKLGYVNLHSGGKGLVYFTRMVGRITHKGFSSQTIKINSVPEVVTVMNELGQDIDRYYEALVQNNNSVKECFNPIFVGFDTAVAVVVAKADATGLAVTNEIAVTLGTRKDDAVILLWKELQAAYSTDGKSWRFAKDEFKGPILRALPGLNYVN